MDGLYEENSVKIEIEDLDKTNRSRWLIDDMNMIKEYEQNKRDGYLSSR